MIDLSSLPALNATLNSIALVLLLAGYRFVRRGEVTAHKRCMIAAFATSVLFLASYLTYRFFGEEKRFSGTGLIRRVYFSLLISHIALAATVPLLATYTLVEALRGRFAEHRRIARITFPIWIYVSITGVLVYLLLFKIYGPAHPTPDPQG